MLSFLKRLGRRLRIGSLGEGDFSSSPDRSVESTDVLASAGQRDDFEFNPQGSGYPPGYVKAYDEGRPKK
jgi:hypothetical protein